MNTQLNHVALSVEEFEWHVHFFHEVLGMSIKKSAGEKPTRKIWFNEGIQLNEVTKTIEDIGVCNHLGIETSDVRQTLKRAYLNGCTESSQGEQWFCLPSGIVIELKESCV